MEFILKILGESPSSPYLEKYIDLLEETIIKGLTDALPSVRSTSRQCYSLFSEKWKQRGILLFDKLTHDVQKYLHEQKNSKDSVKNLLSTQKIMKTKKIIQKNEGSSCSSTSNSLLINNDKKILKIPSTPNNKLTKNKNSISNNKIIKSSPSINNQQQTIPKIKSQNLLELELQKKSLQDLQQKNIQKQNILQKDTQKINNSTMKENLSEKKKLNKTISNIQSSYPSGPLRVEIEIPLLSTPNNYLNKSVNNISSLITFTPLKNLDLSSASLKKNYPKSEISKQSYSRVLVNSNNSNFLFYFINEIF